MGDGTEGQVLGGWEKKFMPLPRQYDTLIWENPQTNKTMKSLLNFFRAQAEPLVVRQGEEWEAMWSSSLNVHLIYIVRSEVMQATKKEDRKKDEDDSGSLLRGRELRRDLYHLQ